MSRAATVIIPATEVAQALDHLNAALDILLADTPPDTMKRMTIQEFGLTPRGLCIRAISSAIEIIEELSE